MKSNTYLNDMRFATGFFWRRLAKGVAIVFELRRCRFVRLYVQLISLGNPCLKVVIFSVKPEQARVRM